MPVIEGYRFQVSLEDRGLGRGLKTLQTEARALKSVMRANFSELKNGEGTLAAYSQRAKDANSAIGSYREAINSLQESVRKTENSIKSQGYETEKQNRSIARNINTISRYRREISNLDAQREKDLFNAKRVATGIDDLRRSTESANSANKTYQQSLEASSRYYAADRAHVAGLIRERKSLSLQMTAESRVTDLYRERSAKLVDEQRNALVTLQGLRRQLAQTKAALDISTQSTGENSKQTTYLRNRYKELQSDVGNAKNKLSSYTEQVTKNNVKLTNQQEKLRTVTNRFTQLSRATSSVHTNKIASVGRAIANVNRQFKGSFSNTREWASNVSGSFSTVSTAATAMGAGLVKSALDAAKVQKQYIEVKNLLETSGESVRRSIGETNKMQREGVKYSEKYGFSQQEIGKQYETLARRGYSGRAALSSMNAMMKASRASGDDLADVVKVTAQAVDAFGLRTNNAAKMMQHTNRVANAMASAADRTASGFQDMGVAMGYVSGSAKTVGWNVEQTSAAIGELSNRGLEGTRAGTGFRKVINSLIKPTASATKALHEAGLSMNDLQTKSGHLKRVDTLFQLINRHTQGWSKTKKGAFFSKIFGATGQQAAQFLAASAGGIKKNDDELTKLIHNINSDENTKYIDRLARKNMQSGQMQIERLKQTAEAFEVTVGSAVLPAVVKVGNEVSKWAVSKEGTRSLGRFKAGLMGIVDFAVSHRHTLSSFASGLLSGLKGAYDTTKLLLKPLGWVLSTIDKMSGSGHRVANVLGRIVGFVAGSIISFKLIKGLVTGIVAVGKDGVGIATKTKNLLTGQNQEQTDLNATLAKTNELLNNELSIQQRINAVQDASSGGSHGGNVKQSAEEAADEASDTFTGRMDTNLESDKKGVKWRKAFRKAPEESAKAGTGSFHGLIGSIKGKISEMSTADKINAASAIAFSAVDIGSSFYSAITSKNISARARGWGGGIGGLLGFAIGSAIPGFGPIIGEQLGKSIGEAAAPAFESLGKELAKFNKSMLHTPKSWEKGWHGFTSWAGKLGSNSAKALKKGWKGMQSWANKVHKNVRNGWHGFTNWAGKLGHSAAVWFKGKWKGMQSWATKTNKNVQRGWHGFTNWAGKTSHQAVRWFRNKWSGMESWASKVHKNTRAGWKGFTSWTGKLGKSSVSALQKAWKSSPKFFSGLSSKIKNVFSGLWNGIKKGAQAAVGGIRNIINGAKSGIHNISKRFATGTGPITEPTLGVLNDGNDSPETGNREGLIHSDGSLEVLQGRNIKRLLWPGEQIINASDLAYLAVHARQFATGTKSVGRVTAPQPGVLNGLRAILSALKQYEQELRRVKRLGETIRLSIKGGNSAIKQVKQLSKSFSDLARYVKPVERSLAKVTGSIKTRSMVASLNKINKALGSKSKKSKKAQGLIDSVTNLNKLLKAFDKTVKNLNKPVVKIAGSVNRASKSFRALASKHAGISSATKALKSLYKATKKYPFGKRLAAQARAAIKGFRGKGNFSSAFRKMAETTIKYQKDFASDFKKRWKEMFKNTYKEETSWIKDMKTSQSKFGNSWSKGFRTIDSGVEKIFVRFWSNMRKTAGKGINDVLSVLNAGISGISSVVREFGGSASMHHVRYVHYATGTGVFNNARRPITKPTLAMLNDGNDSPETNDEEAIWNKRTGNVSVVHGRNVPALLTPDHEVFNASETRQLGFTHYASGTGSLKYLYELTKKFYKNPTGTLSSMFKGLGNSVKGVMKSIAEGMKDAAQGSAQTWWTTLWKMVHKKIEDSDGPASGLLKAVEKYGHGHSYVWGAAGPNAFDCSGLVMYALKKAYGISYPHFSGAQYARTQHISKSQARMGDLVFWGPGGSDHVGVYAGGSRYYSAESPSMGIHMNTLSSVVGKGAPKFGRVRDVNTQGHKHDTVKANSALEKFARASVGKGFWATIRKIVDKYGVAGNPAGDGVARWRNIIKAALSANHLAPTSWRVHDMMRLIARESGGNPRAVNNWDINAQHGDPSKGIAQITVSNFRTYHHRGHNNILNGYDNLLAAIRYIIAKYGSGVAAFNRVASGAYANGGIATRASIFGEAGPEMAIPLSKDKLPRAVQLLAETVAIMQGQAGGSAQQQEEQKEEKDFKKQLIGLLKDIASGQGNNSTPIQININMDGKKIAQDVMPYFEKQQRRRITYGRNGFSNGI